MINRATSRFLVGLFIFVGGGEADAAIVKGDGSGGGCRPDAAVDPAPWRR